jgi:hypothetical protein
VYDGRNGTPLFESPNPSCTVHESPVIADVDRDGRAEVVVATNDLCDIRCAGWATSPQVAREKVDALRAAKGATYVPTHHDAAALGVNQHGITVFKDLRDRWVSTRPVWNQHAYSVTNIRTDGSVPYPVESNWLVEGLNNFRMNTIEDPDFSAPDLVVGPAESAFDRADCARGVLRIRAAVWNRGVTPVSQGVPVALFHGDPAGAPLTIVRTEDQILPGRSITVTLEIPSAPTVPTSFTVVADSDEQGLGVAGECDETNNALAIPGAFCPPPVR